MPDAPRSDEELAAAVKTGDGGAFRALVERYERPLHGFLTRVTGDSHTADDVFQETFIRVMKGIGRYDEDRPFRPWLYRIALNQARNSFRRTKREPRVSLDARSGGDGGGGEVSIGELIASAAECPSHAAARGEDAELIRGAVDRLPGKGRDALVMFYFEGLRYDEVAEVLEIPLGTVKSRIHNALAKLVLVVTQERARRSAARVEEVR